MARTALKLVSDTDYVAPHQLQKVLRTADSKVITFSSEKRMQLYRRNLYSINKQGQFRYRTIRDEESMWGIIVYRTH